MGLLTAELEVEKRNNDQLRRWLTQSEESSRTDSETMKKQLEANIRRIRELEVEVSEPVMVLCNLAKDLLAGKLCLHKAQDGWAHISDRHTIMFVLLVAIL